MVRSYTWLWWNHKARSGDIKEKNNKRMLNARWTIEFRSKTEFWTLLMKLFFSIDLLNYHNTTHYVIIISLTSEKKCFLHLTHILHSYLQTRKRAAAAVIKNAKILHIKTLSKKCKHFETIFLFIVSCVVDDPMSRIDYHWNVKHMHFPRNKKQPEHEYRYHKEDK